MRFYLPSSGEIRIDGHRIEALNINWIRNNITLVEQRSVLFNDSIYQNIVFGHQDHTALGADDIQKSVELAMLQSTIDGLPNGLETCVGPGGSFLSGGQKQRIAIARARLRDSPILILDEPTSALDHNNRVAVTKAIREWRTGKTTIIITHDMSQILEDDYVYILDHGSIVESGYRNKVEKRSGCEKYFHWKSQRVPESEKTSFPSSKKESSSSWASLDASSTDSETDQPVIPQRVYQQRNTSWENYHTSLGLRSSADDIAAKRPPNYRVSSDQNSENFSQNGNQLDSRMKNPKTTVHEAVKCHTGTPHSEVEMVEMDTDRTTDEHSYHPASAHSYDWSALCDRSSRKWSLSRKTKRNDLTSLSKIMATIVPNLTSRQCIVLFLGVTAALAHASATPIFSCCVSQLVGTFYVSRNSVKLTMKWSLAVLGVSLGDGISSYFMHYLLEYCGEAWMDALRKRAFQRVLVQPRAWFDKDGNGSFRIASYLDQNSEDMRNLLGRFAGFGIVAAAITIMAIIWSLAICWKLTLVALACGPVIYTITRGFEGTNGQWERKCNAASAVASDIFTETFSEIRTVRTLTLEGYFHRKQNNAIIFCLRMGFKRAIYAGLLFGMVESIVIFASGN